MRVHRQKSHSDAILARRGKFKTNPGALALEETMRNLNQNSRPVAGLRIAAARSPVRQVDQDLHALEHNVVGLVPGHIRHKADAAGIVLMHRVIEPLSRG